jgi:hypothetical protein
MYEPIEQVMAIYPLNPLESILEKDVEHFKEDDLGEDLHLLTKRASSPSISLKSLPTGPQDAKFFKKENPWAMEKIEVLTLESEREGSIGAWKLLS